MSTKSERATIAFYHWEARGRGYLLSDNTVEMEPPFAPFLRPKNTEAYDDGRLPSFLSQAKELFLGATNSKKDEQELPEIVPRYNNHIKRKAISIFFPYGQDISALISQELLNLLSYSQEAFSFEIIAQKGSVEIVATAGIHDLERLRSQLKGYFPDIVIRDSELYNFNFDLEEPIAIADFALDKEFMLPLGNETSFTQDPLTPIIASLESLNDSDTAVVQVIFKGVSAPWSEEILYASSDGNGNSFFEGYPEFITGVKEKIANPLFGVVFRIAAQGKNENQSSYIAGELARSISTISNSGYNKLIPLSNEGYDYDNHIKNLYNRTSHRLPFIVNTAELAQFVHYPNKTIVSAKLGAGNHKTKAPKSLSEIGTYLGDNNHNGEVTPTYLDTESRLSHTVILGATGTGKSTLIANMALSDINAGYGTAVFDPHGDLINDVLKRIPNHRKDDVILIDPSDIEYPIGFNLLEAKSESEKIVLSSDLVSAFKKHATAWGDTMTSVLSNAIATMLESTEGGTLIELKRFLIEDQFRNHYLKTVPDPSLQYYWNHEYPMVKKRISPLLTRIDTFLRPKLVRYMLAQKKGVDIHTCILENKIILLKLSQGLIGTSNSYLLASLFLAKINQAILARQSLKQESRIPYFLYCDEYQNYLTPSIEKILSSARKYGLGLTLANQELAQIQDSQLLNSILSNPKTRICFRLGDADAKRLESGFSYFESSDLQNLSRGEAIVRIDTARNDFNLKTSILKNHEEDNSEYIKTHTRTKYALPREEVENILISLLPSTFAKTSSKKEIPEAVPERLIEEKTELGDPEPDTSILKISEEKRNNLIASDNESREIRTHIYLQSTIKKLGQDRNFIATVEAPTDDGGRIDILLQRDELKIGFEISETNKPAYEVENIKKCLKAGCIPVVVVSKNKQHLNAIEKRANEILSDNDIKLVKFIQTDGVAPLLDMLMKPPTKNEEIIKGFRVTTEFEKVEDKKITDIKSKLKRLFKPKK